MKQKNEIVPLPEDKNLPVVATNEVLSFYADKVLYTGMGELQRIIEDKGEIKSHPDTKIRAIQAVVSISKLMMSKREAEKKKRYIEIPEDMRIG